MKKIEIEQGTRQWLDLRKNMIGGSDAAPIMGISPWTTPHQLWCQKMGLSEVKQNEAMRRGLHLEPRARQKFIEEIGHDVFPIVGFHESISFMMASFDGISACGKITVEIKCPGREDHEIAMEDIIPEKYFPQLQHQMEVAGLESMFYFSFNEKSYKMLEIEKDINFTDKMIREERNFWECMQNLEAPELVERDYIQRNDDEWVMLAREWIELSKIEDRKEEVRKKLMHMCGRSNTMGGGIKLSKIPRKGTIDYKAIPELMEVDLEKYRKASIETYRIGIYA